MINFPLYEIRGYVDLFDEDGYKIIQTNRNRYVLDYAAESSSLYVDRRIRLLGRIIPYELYPLNKRIETISQMMLSKVKTFIDKKGKLVSWKPTTFYPVVCVPIKSTWITAKGYMGIELKGLSTKFIITPGDYKYAQVIQVGEKNILFDLCEEMRPRTRKKL